MQGEALAAQVDGNASSPPVVMLHGFTQTARCWGTFGADLRADHRVVALDAPGHGNSSELHGDLWRTAGLAVAAGGTATYLGYSMGARIALHAALAFPASVTRLVLISGTAGIDDPEERAARRRADESLAARIGHIGVDAFLREWLAQPLFADLSAQQHDLAERRRNRAEGLAASLRELGTGTQEPLWDRLGELAMPVLLITGDADARYGHLARRAAEAIGPNATHVVLRGGHSVHRQAPDAAAVVRRWLRS